MHNLTTLSKRLFCIMRRPYSHVDTADFYCFKAIAILFAFNTHFKLKSFFFFNLHTSDSGIAPVDFSHIILPVCAKTRPINLIGNEGEIQFMSLT